MSSSREHAYTTERDENPVEAPSHAERARTLLHLCREGMLSTHSVKQPGFPFGSLMPFALDATPVPEDVVAGVRETYLNRHENAGYWVDFKDFDFYRLDVVDIYFVGGFGVMGWVDASDFTKAAPDPLEDAAVEIIRHMNADHTDGLLLLARVIKGIEAEEARMTAVDRLGFHVRLKTPTRMRSARIGFPKEVRTAGGCRTALIAMVKTASRGDS